MYGRLGVYKALFPFAGSAEAAAFCRGVLDPIKEYDAENNAEIFPTLERYVVSGCSVRAAASALGIHENTLRYRLEKAASVTVLAVKPWSIWNTRLSVTSALEPTASRV